MQQTQIESKPDKNEKIIPFVPESNFYFVHGVKAFQKRKFDTAIKWLKIAINKNSDEPVFKCQLSVVYTEIGAYHEANQLLNEVLLNEKDEYVDCYYLLANNYAHLGLMDDAKKYADLYLKKDPDGDFLDEAKDLLELISFEETEEEFNADWDLENEDELLIYQETAFYYVESCQWKKALPILEQLLQSFPDHKQAKHEYAQALFFSGSKQQAMDMEEAHLAEDENSLYSHANLALFYFLDNDPAYQTHLRTLGNIYPMHEQQQLMIASILARTGHVDEALERFNKLNKVQMTTHLSYFRWYSYALFHIGQSEQAHVMWDKGQLKHPILKQEKAPWEK